MPNTLETKLPQNIIKHNKKQTRTSVFFTKHLALPSSLKVAFKAWLMYSYEITQKTPWISHLHSVLWQCRGSQKYGTSSGDASYIQNLPYSFIPFCTRTHDTLEALLSESGEVAEKSPEEGLWQWRFLGDIWCAEWWVSTPGALKCRFPWGRDVPVSASSWLALSHPQASSLAGPGHKIKWTQLLGSQLQKTCNYWGLLCYAFSYQWWLIGTMP